MFVLPEPLPTSLARYAPGRVVEVPDVSWPVFEVRDRVGVTSTIPRYALEVLTVALELDPARVRWLAETTDPRPLSDRHVHVVTHRGRLHVVDGHHALAAHLAAGTERIPVRLVTPTLVHDPVLTEASRTAGAA
ncbi:MAG: hypothetical protein ACLFUG_08550 [Nitriliruptoraceae bacterium]